MKTISSTIKKVNSQIYNLPYKFCDWLQRKLYDEFTRDQLESKLYSMELQVKELQNELEYFKELEAYRENWLA